MQKPRTVIVQDRFHDLSCAQQRRILYRVAEFLLNPVALLFQGRPADLAHHVQTVGIVAIL